MKTFALSLRSDSEEYDSKNSEESESVCKLWHEIHWMLVIRKESESVLKNQNQFYRSRKTAVKNLNKESEEKSESDELLCGIHS